MSDFTYQQMKPARSRGFTLAELMISITVLGFVMVGVSRFAIENSRLAFTVEKQLEINRDIRRVTSEMADEARQANYFVLYASFFPLISGDPIGDFRDPESGYTAADYRRRKSHSGDFVVFVYTGEDPNPNDTTPPPIVRLVGYFRDDPEFLGIAQPVRKFAIDIPVSDQGESVEDLIPDSDRASSYSEVISLISGLNDGDLFYNIGERSVVVNGKIMHGNTAKQITGTYNFTISPRG